LARYWRFAWWGAARIISAPSSPWFADEATKHAALARALGRSADWLANRFGAGARSWGWGELHPFAPRHPLAFPDSFSAGAPPAWSAPGSTFTVLQHRFDAAKPPFSITISPAVRMVADLATDEVQVALPTGESGHIASPYLTDQVGAWRN